MLRLTILLILIAPIKTQCYSQKSSDSTSTTVSDSVLVDLKTINHVLADLESNVVYADSLYSETKLLRLSLDNCGEIVYNYTVLDSLKQSVIKGKDVEIFDLTETVEKKSFLNRLFGLSTLVSVALMLLGGG